MSKSRNMADLLDSNGDVKSGALDNVPPSNDASALTTGTLSVDRLGAGSIAAAKLAETYLTPTGDGSGLTGINAGKILKYQTGSYTTEEAVSSTSFDQFTGLGTITFQPTTSNSVIVFIIFSNNAGSTYTDKTQIKLERSSSSNLEVGIHTDWTSDNNLYSSFTFTDVFTNSGTSAVSYKMYGRLIGGSSPQSMRINRNQTNGTRWIFMELEP